MFDADSNRLMLQAEGLFSAKSRLEPVSKSNDRTEVTLPDANPYDRSRPGPLQTVDALGHTRRRTLYEPTGWGSLLRSQVPAKGTRQ